MKLVPCHWCFLSYVLLNEFVVTEDLLKDKAGTVSLVFPVICAIK